MKLRSFPPIFAIWAPSQQLGTKEYMTNIKNVKTQEKHAILITLFMPRVRNKATTSLFLFKFLKPLHAHLRNVLLITLKYSPEK